MENKKIKECVTYATVFKYKLLHSVIVSLPIINVFIFRHRLDWKSVLWIRNDSDRIRILLFTSFRKQIWIRPFNPLKLTNWPILRLYNGTKTWKHFSDFLRNMYRYVIKDEIDHFNENLQKLYRFSCQQSQIRIQYKYFGSGSDLAISSQSGPDPDPQHCWKGNQSSLGMG